MWLYDILHELCRIKPISLLRDDVPAVLYIKLSDLQLPEPTILFRCKDHGRSMGL